MSGEGREGGRQTGSQKEENEWVHVCSMAGKHSWNDKASCDVAYILTLPCRLPF